MPEARGRRRRRARRSARWLTRRRGTGRRRSSALIVRRARPVGGQRRRCRRSSTSATRSLRRTRRVDVRRRRRRPCTGPIRPACPRADSGSVVVVAERRLARRDAQHVGAQRVDLGERSARLDAEMPTTATIAAMPMAMPSAVSAVRDRRARSPIVPTRAGRPGAAGCGDARRSPARAPPWTSGAGAVARHGLTPRPVVDRPAVAHRHPAGCARRCRGRG